MGLVGDAGVGGNRGRGFRLVVEAGGRKAIGLPALGGILACSARSFPTRLPRR